MADNEKPGYVKRLRRRGERYFSSDPYVARLIIYIVIFLIFLLVAAILENSFLQDLLVQTGFVFGSVALVQIVTDFFSLEISFAVTEDARNAGMKRIWTQRRYWQGDQHGGWDHWHRVIAEAQCVDIVSDSFWEARLADDQFREVLAARAQNAGQCTRILILAPDSPALQQRAKELGFTVPFLNAQSMNSMAALQNMIPGQSRQNGERCFQVRLMWHVIPHGQIIRADKRVIYSPYWTGVEPAMGSPAFELEASEDNNKRCLASRLESSFESMWNRSQDWNPSAQTPDTTSVEDSNGSDQETQTKQAESAAV